MLSQNIRREFIDFFVRHGHTHVSSSPVIPHNDPTLLFTNAGMNQFKDVFLGQPREYTRAVSSQKCIRAGGKHNDLENVGHTTRHLTFFEMLGNFSFGDYFKKEAIEMAWKVSTEVFGFDEERIWPTVFENDDEAFEMWTQWVPAHRITRLGAKDNFWAMGDTGPCGPCSELLFDRGASFSQARNPAEDKTGERFLEFWNLVFMQYNRQLDGQQATLAKQSIDTGSGLERVVCLKMGVESVFQTDTFQHIIRHIERLSQKTYPRDLALAAPFHVIADHLRSLSFAIADGAQPSNVDRGYVLRKILRRASRYGRKLGLEDPFMAGLLPSLIEVMGEDYPEIAKQQSRIEEILTLEEEANCRTLKRGGKLLADVCQKAKEASRGILAQEAFSLKDTYGLPLEEIELIAHDEGLKLDHEGFLNLEKEARELSRSRHQKTHQIAQEDLFKELSSKEMATLFVGYEQDSCQSQILALYKEGKITDLLEAGDEGLVILDITPFYAEKGGQATDTGLIETSNGSFDVFDVQNPSGSLIIHYGKVEKGFLKTGEKTFCEIDQKRRRGIERSHSATHLLHWALFKVLGDHIQQKGSLVEKDMLRFDFSHHKQVSEEQFHEIESLINQKILENTPIQTYEKAYSEVKAEASIKQFFGDKYGLSVRVIDIDYSKELCGGTHVKSTGCIGSIKLTKESSIAAGIRRLEALVGMEASYHHRNLQQKWLTIAKQLRASEEQVEEKFKSLQDQHTQLAKQIEEMRKDKMKGVIQNLLKETQVHQGIPTLISKNPVALEDLGSLVQALSMFEGVAFIACHDQEKVQIAAFCSKKAQMAGFKANDLIQKVSPVLDARGGGRPDMAQAGGKKPSHTDEALKIIRGLLAGENS
jgi:alanyl-tRNA synthetase